MQDLQPRRGGGHSTASTAPQGREECPGDPRNQAVGPPKAGKRGENGGVTVPKEAAIHYVDRTLAPEPNATRAYKQWGVPARKLNDPSRYPLQHHRRYTRPRSCLQPAAQASSVDSPSNPPPGEGWCTPRTRDRRAEVDRKPVPKPQGDSSSAG
jgi:hypothetical protein